MRTAAVVVSHRNAAELERLLPALEPQVDELIVVANVPGSAGTLPPTARLIENERPRGFGANVNAGVGRVDRRARVQRESRRRPARRVRSRRSATSWSQHPRAGVAGPRMLYPDGSLQPSRRRFPTVAGTLVRRTPLRRVLDPKRVQERHYYSGDAPTEPVQSDWMLGGFLMLRRTMLDELGGFDEGFFLYGEDIDLCYRAAQAGWERWYVPGAVVEHEHQAVTDRRLLTRRTLWHWRGILRFVRKHPERLRALV